jgi:hypothetical protein
MRAAKKLFYTVHHSIVLSDMFHSIGYIPRIYAALSPFSWENIFIESEDIACAPKITINNIPEKGWCIYNREKQEIYMDGEVSKVGEDCDRLYVIGDRRICVKGSKAKILGSNVVGDLVAAESGIEDGLAIISQSFPRIYRIIVGREMVNAKHVIYNSNMWGLVVGFTTEDKETYVAAKPRGDRLYLEHVERDRKGVREASIGYEVISAILGDESTIIIHRDGSYVVDTPARAIIRTPGQNVIARYGNKIFFASREDPGIVGIVDENVSVDPVGIISEDPVLRVGAILYIVRERALEHLANIDINAVVSASGATIVADHGKLATILNRKGRAVYAVEKDEQSRCYSIGSEDRMICFREDWISVIGRGESEIEVVAMPSEEGHMIAVNPGIPVKINGSRCFDGCREVRKELSLLRQASFQIEIEHALGTDTIEIISEPLDIAISNVEVKGIHSTGKHRCGSPVYIKIEALGKGFSKRVVPTARVINIDSRLDTAGDRITASLCLEYPPKLIDIYAVDIIANDEKLLLTAGASIDYIEPPRVDVNVEHLSDRSRISIANIDKANIVSAMLCCSGICRKIPLDGYTFSDCYEPAWVAIKAERGEYTYEKIFSIKMPEEAIYTCLQSSKDDLSASVCGYGGILMKIPQAQKPTYRVIEKIDLVNRLNNTAEIVVVAKKPAAITIYNRDVLNIVIDSGINRIEIPYDPFSKTYIAVRGEKEPIYILNEDLRELLVKAYVASRELLRRALARGS